MKTKLILVICLLCFLASCASLESVKEGKSSGVSVVYKTSIENAWVYAKKIFNENGITIQEEILNENIFGRSEAHTADNGRFIGVWFNEVNENEVEVTSYSLQVMSTKFGNWFDHEDFHQKFKIYVDTE